MRFIKSTINLIGRNVGKSHMGAIIYTVSPHLKAAQRDQALKDLGFLDKNIDILNLKGNTQRNNIKYWVSSSKYMGIWFGASHFNNQIL